MGRTPYSKFGGFKHAVKEIAQCKRATRSPQSVAPAALPRCCERNTTVRAIKHQAHLFESYGHMAISAAGVSESASTFVFICTCTEGHT